MPFGCNSKHRALVTPARRGRGNKPKATDEGQEQTPVERRTWFRPASQCLHVAAAIGDSVDKDSVAFNAVDDSIGLEKHLSEIMRAERSQLPRVGPTLRQTEQALENFGSVVEYVLGLFGRVIPCYPGIQFLKVSGPRRG